MTFKQELQRLRAANRKLKAENAELRASLLLKRFETAGIPGFQKREAGAGRKG